MNLVEITDQEFAGFQSILSSSYGISLSSSKKTLVASRLSKRLREYDLRSYGEYLKLINSGEHPGEMQTAINLLTTNETYFFREPNHFKYLQTYLQERHSFGDHFRIWSAACSSGQEPYSVAMLLYACLGNRPWGIMASDINSQVIDTAKRGIYPISQADNIPDQYINQYCLKGVGAQSGYFIIDRLLRSRINYSFINLNSELPRIGEFDIIFLRNVMIYFNNDTKRHLIERLLRHLKRDGHLFIGHSESITGITNQLKMIAPAIYRRI